MAIQNVSLIGLGALGILYAHHLYEKLPVGQLRIVADAQRIRRYKKDGIYCNGKKCDFTYLEPQENMPAADLIIIATKFDGLEHAIEAIAPQVHEHTIIISLINGIISEEIISLKLPKANVLNCVAQGMDAGKISNKMTYVNKGVLVIGDRQANRISQQTTELAAFFNSVDLPYEIDQNMPHRLWGKFMLNVGVNQTVALIEGTFADVFHEGEPRTMMIEAMQEVIIIANAEGIDLAQDDLDYWLAVLSTLNPEGKPSMAQDVEAKRLSELPLFAGTVISLGEKHQIPTPINDKLFKEISYREQQY